MIRLCSATVAIVLLASGQRESMDLRVLDREPGSRRWRVRFDAQVRLGSLKDAIPSVFPFDSRLGDL